MVCLMGRMFSYCSILVQHSLSYIRYDTLNESQHRQLTGIETMMLGANGLPLDAKGLVELIV